MWIRSGPCTRVEYSTAPEAARPDRVEFIGSAGNPLTHYIIVRSDLPRGVQAAMIVHATGESLERGHGEGTYAVVLAAKDQAALEHIAAFLEARGVSLVRVHEPDPPFDGALMALGLKPGRKEELRRHVSAIPLLR